MPRLPMRSDAAQLAALLARRGWVALPHDPKIAAWAAAAHAAACVVTADPAQQQRWLHHGATWFVGVDALPNGPDGGIGGVALAGDWRGLVRMPGQLHPAQVSVIHPGYPGRDPADTDAAHRFRRDRDAAHLDGLLAEGADKRRHLREPHAFVLGLALTATSAGASPLVVWEASPAIIRAAFVAVYAGISPDRWGDVDVTDAYQAARARVFADCRRVVVHAQPGQAVLVHRLAIHGVAPWDSTAKAPPEGRMIAYFRPILADPAAWLATD